MCMSLKWFCVDLAKIIAIISSVEELSMQADYDNETLTIYDSNAYCITEITTISAVHIITEITIVSAVHCTMEITTISAGTHAA